MKPRCKHCSGILTVPAEIAAGIHQDCQVARDEWAAKSRAEKDALIDSSLPIRGPNHDD